MNDHGRPVKPPASQPQSQTTRISGKLDQVKGAMQDNIGKALERGTNLNELQDKTEQLEASGKDFYKTSGEVKRMFQWKAFLWQLAFAGVILLILSAVTLYILSATGVLNGRGRSSPAVVASVPLVATQPADVAPAPAAESPIAALFSLNPGMKAFKQPADLPVGVAAGEKCTLGGISTITAKCGEGLTCVTPEGSTEGICRALETPFPPEKLVTETAAQESGCPPGEVPCTEERTRVTPCIIGRCIASPTSEKTVPLLPPRSTEPKPSAPLTGAAKVYKANGEDPTKTEAEIREALVTLHRHGVECSMGIVHKDCTLDLMMQSWGVWT
jgi:uncharacterized protein YjbJ (UPF0337 family)